MIILRSVYRFSGQNRLQGGCGQLQPPGNYANHEFVQRRGNMGLFLLQPGIGSLAEYIQLTAAVDNH